ncbi:YchJ family protein [Streptomyces sp. NA04227]|uniref:YchJ family protein n=1 Tax=Streptomyces sp. NA04227 TaxID=2742136 RepID=UPI00159126A3|nr:YchJ family protein [Streptomyces sp. NA04227]QKW05660.1 YchJ family protein [Streptomyces sp. NA04227]
MARRTSRNQRPVTNSRTAAAACPCGTGRTYADCCGACHTGASPAPTAEALMRSRYSAFARGEADYLLRTWHPRTRPARLDLDSGTRWRGLEILRTEGGSAFHTTGTVTFRASYEDAQGGGVLAEHSRFERYEGAWVYVDGDVAG